MEDRNFITLFIVLLSLLFIGSMLLWGFLLRKRKKQNSETFVPVTRREPRRFVGERIYSLALRGKYQSGARVIMVLSIVFPLFLLFFLWNVTPRLPDGSWPWVGGGRFWWLGGAMFVSSGVTITYLRAMLRYRAGMKVLLNRDGVRMLAVKVGVFPARDVFLRWGRIEKVVAADPRNPAVITVQSTDDSFQFDTRYAVEVLSFGIAEAETLIDSGNDLHHDLLFHSGLTGSSIPTRVAGMPV